MRASRASRPPTSATPATADIPTNGSEPRAARTRGPKVRGSWISRRAPTTATRTSASRSETSPPRAGTASGEPRSPRRDAAPALTPASWELRCGNSRRTSSSSSSLGSRAAYSDARSPLTRSRRAASRGPRSGTKARSPVARFAASTSFRHQAAQIARSSGDMGASIRLSTSVAGMSCGSKGQRCPLYSSPAFASPMPPNASASKKRSSTPPLRRLVVTANTIPSTTPRASRGFYCRHRRTRREATCASVSHPISARSPRRPPRTSETETTLTVVLYERLGP